MPKTAEGGRAMRNEGRRKEGKKRGRRRGKSSTEKKNAKKMQMEYVFYR